MITCIWIAAVISAGYAVWLANVDKHLAARRERALAPHQRRERREELAREGERAVREHRIAELESVNHTMRLEQDPLYAAMHIDEVRAIAAKRARARVAVAARRELR